jgi:succinoglycan biosynthesis protein ExoO
MRAWESTVTDLNQPSEAPIVSIVMPTYNAASFVGRAVDSVRAQTVTNWELLIVDDCSTDSTMDVVNALVATDARIRVIRLEQNGGPSVARNRGFDEARGEWIAIIDADDAYLPDRLEKLLAATQDLDMVADPLLYFDAGAAKTARTWRLPEHAPKWTLAGLFDSHRPRSDSYAILKPLFKRSFLNEHGLRYRPTYRYAEDFILYADVLRKGARAGVIPSAHYLYTMPIGSLSKAPSGRSKTLINGRVFLDQLKAFEEAERAHLTDDEYRALMQCYDARLQYTWVVDFKAHLRKRRLGTAVGALVRHPVILKDIAAVMRRRLLGTTA